MTLLFGDWLIRFDEMMDVKKFCDTFRLSCVMLQKPIKTVILSNTSLFSLSLLLATIFKTIAATIEVHLIYSDKNKLEDYIIECIIIYYSP